MRQLSEIIMSRMRGRANEQSARRYQDRRMPCNGHATLLELWKDLCHSEA
jgi:hypothetical protein